MRTIATIFVALLSCAEVSTDNGAEDAGTSATCPESVVEYSIYRDDRDLLSLDCFGEDYHRLDVTGSCAEFTCEWFCASLDGEDCAFVSLRWNRCGRGSWSEPEIATSGCLLE